MPDGHAAEPIVLISSPAADPGALAQSLRGEAADAVTVLTVRVADDGSVPAALLDAGIDGARFVFLARDERDATPSELAAIDPARWRLHALDALIPRKGSVPAQVLWERGSEHTPRPLSPRRTAVITPHTCSVLGEVCDLVPGFRAPHHTPRCSRAGVCALLPA